MTGQLLMSQDAINHDKGAWLERRRAGITGTEVAQLLGISNYGTAFSLYHAKIDGTETEDKPAMQRGRHLEPVVEDMLLDDRPWLRLRNAGLYREAGRPWRMATLDRWVMDTRPRGAEQVDYFQYGPGIAAAVPVDVAAPGEIKTWATKNGPENARWGDPGTNDIPVGIRAQALWNMDVVGADEIIIPVLFMDRWVVEVYRLTRDMPGAQSDLDLMVTEAERFLHRVACRDEPPVDDHPATTETLRNLHPDLVDESVRVPLVLWRRYHAARAAKDRAEARVRGAQNELRQRMGPAARAHVVVPGLADPVKVVSRSIGDHPVREHTRHDDKLNPGRTRPGDIGKDTP